MTTLEHIHSLFEKKEAFLATRTPGNSIQVFYPTIESNWSACVSNFDKSKKVFFSNKPNDMMVDAENISPPNTSSKSEYEQQFESIQNEINAGNLSKAILSRVKRLEKKIDSPVNLFSKLEATYPDACVYILSTDQSTWIGATPELLASQKEGKTCCTSLAGTLPIEEQEWTEKEIHEQHIVTKFIADKFKQHGRLYEQTGPEDKIAGEVRHLFTKLTGEIKNHDSFIDDLHPTPAISGFPQQNAIEAIHAIEKHDRLWYTGYLRFKNNQEDLAFVNLRCMQIVDSRAYLYLGGGITRDSVMEKEWQETEMKAKTLQSVIDTLH